MSPLLCIHILYTQVYISDSKEILYFGVCIEISGSDLNLTHTVLIEPAR
jgi:hypothetical protein